MEQATFAAGCFWGVDALFAQQDGVIETAVGSQYRSAVFYHNEDQHHQAQTSLERLEQSGAWAAPIVTQILPAGPFHRAEEYHQQYLAKRGVGSCQL